MTNQIAHIRRTPALRHAPARGGRARSRRGESFLEEAIGCVRVAHDTLRGSLKEAAATSWSDERLPSERAARSPPRGCEASARLTKQLAVVPDAQREREDAAAAAAARGRTRGGGIDWATRRRSPSRRLLGDGIPIRLTGQTASAARSRTVTCAARRAHRGDRHSDALARGDARVVRVCTTHRSRSSPASASRSLLGRGARALVLWEAQFGDFAKRRADDHRPVHHQRSREVGAAPTADAAAAHGYEATARALQRAARAVPAAGRAGEHPHRQPEHRRPVLSPARRRRSIRLRARWCDDAQGPAAGQEAASTLEELSEGSFAAVLDAPLADKQPIRRLALCSGKSTTTSSPRRRCTRRRRGAARAALPVPVAAVHELVDSYPALDEVVWVQEEPQNMGAWRTIRHVLRRRPAGSRCATSAATARVGRRGLPIAHAVGRSGSPARSMPGRRLSARSRRPAPGAQRVRRAARRGGRCVGRGCEPNAPGAGAAPGRRRQRS